MTASKNAGSVLGEQSQVGLELAVASGLLSDASAEGIGARSGTDDCREIEGQVVNSVRVPPTPQFPHAQLSPLSCRTNADY